MLDLFAGAGGFSLGFKWAGFRSAMAIDFFQQAIETLESNFGDEGTIVLKKNLFRFKGKQLQEYMEQNQIRAGFDVIIGGPPCQGWSKVGRGKLRSLKEGLDRKKLENDPRNRLYKVYLDHIRTFQPKVAVMENVPGMLSHRGRNIAELVAQGMGAAGYRVSWKLLKASDYGVPQFRERLFFVGVRTDLDIEFQFPQAVDEQGGAAFPLATVWDAISDLPIIRNGAKKWVREYKSKNIVSDFAELMRKGAEPGLIHDHVCRTQNGQDLEAFRLMKQGGKYIDLPAKYKRYRDDIFEDKYRKLRWSRPSGCVTAHLSKDCYTHIHPSQARTISVREAARFQSFPDCFHFSGNMGNKFQLIGNAVPPLLSEKIAIAIKAQIFSSKHNQTPKRDPALADRQT